LKELKRHPEWNWNAWFWLDREEFAGGWKIGQCRYRMEKAVGRDTDGRLFLMIWTNHDQHDRHKFTQSFYEIDLEEYTAFLDRGIEQGEVKPEERERLIEKAKAPFIPPWDPHKAVVVYQDEGYTLGQQADRPYLIANGEKYLLSCHPYEPCLYITSEGDFQTAVHNAFDPSAVLASFYSGDTVASITGFEYDAKDFCRMVEYAADMGNLNIDDAEKVFGNRPKKKIAEKKPRNEKPPQRNGNPPRVEEGRIIEDERVSAILSEYPDIVVDYCIVKTEHIAKGRNAHWYALVCACRKLLIDDDGEAVWRCDLGGAEGKPIDTAALLAAASEKRGANYRGAFLYPPHGGRYSNKAFDRVNAALFPNGTDGLEAYEWTTDWSEYFDEGHEWWGALCLTVYDKTLDRFVVIMASATD